MNILKSLSLLFFLVSIKSCKKAEDRRCVKSAGKETTQEIDMPFFDKLELHENIEFILVQDTINKVILTGGLNLLNEVKLSVSDNQLKVVNKNKCDFLRSYKKVIKAEIHFSNLSFLNYHGTEVLTNRGTLNLPFINIAIINSSGSVDLKLNSNHVSANSFGAYGDFKLSGTTKTADFHINSNGFCKTNDLIVTESMTVLSNTVGLMMVNAHNIALKAETKNGGNIIYKGTPLLIVFNRIGKGNLIQEK